MTTASDRAVILTTNERDALALYEATDGALAFALPHGERVDTSVFPYLEDFEQIFLWFPPRHLEFAKEWGYSLNGGRCYLIRSSERPIELVRNGKYKEVKHILSRESIRLREKGFRSMTDIREELKADLINSSTRQLGIAQVRLFALIAIPLGRFKFSILKLTDFIQDHIPFFRLSRFVEQRYYNKPEKKTLEAKVVEK
ncbi:hypothetical protein OESDEN_00254 [Oesophagostomum dentatum]|uniref:Uncharacterized protein n=1 Tax=Oesophagostomum dentatum TaxID=61180 RepID=A0A0B1TWC1_OESDE|nr:hypothetical protein OESDEN_00254 [Oesophagostomum dentatum]